MNVTKTDSSHQIHFTRGRFVKKSSFNVPVELMFSWHERDGAIERLIPPWDPIRWDSTGCKGNSGNEGGTC